MRRIPLKGWVVALILVFFWNLLFYVPLFALPSPPAPVATIPYSTFLSEAQQGRCAP